MLSFVVAMTEDYVIGNHSKLPWHLPEDLRWFKKITSSGTKTMIMGRKTFEALPKVLPCRSHIILTKNPSYHFKGENIKVFHDVSSIIPYIQSEEEYYVIGGSEIFSLLFPYAKRIYLTIIHAVFEGDTYFPKFNKSEWIVTDCIEGTVDEKNKYAHTYLILDSKFYGF